jgi:hypothetical protein
MSNLRDLLATWESWSARDTVTRALARATTDGQRETLRQAVNDVPVAKPLDALRDATELVALLSGWQWQAIHAARVDGASWDEIGHATGTSGEQARTNYVAALDRHERVRPGSTEQYRERR